MVMRYGLTLFFMLIATSQAFGKVVAVVDQNPAYTNQPFTLEVSIDADLPANAFNSSALLKRGFTVGNTSTSRQFSTINGHSEKQTRWITTLVAKKAGNYLIPSMVVGQEQTDPIRLAVLDTPEVDQEQQEVKLQVSLLQASAYIGEPVTYSTKILVASDLSQSTLSSPKAEHAEIQQLGDDKQDLEIINGRRYKSLTRKWLITPQQAGELTIQAPVLRGRIAIYGQVHAVTLTGEEQHLESKPIPSDFPGEWLASRDLILDEEIEPDQNIYTQGEAFTRTITLTIAGITEEQLPEININYDDAFRIYPEQVKDRTIVKDGLVFSQRTIRIAIIPSDHGTFMLPGFELPWWDLAQDKLAWATVPERIIQVTPAHSEQPQAPMQAEEPETTNTTPNLTVLFAILWIATLACWGLHFIYLRRKAKRVHQEPTPQPTTISAWSQFEQAATSDQVQQADAAFNAWMNEQAAVSPELKNLAGELSQIAWTEQPDAQWDGKAFLNRVKKAHSNQEKAKPQDELPTLNPW